jgi:ABC-type uncharacterized transport system substrate-binding protein
MGDQPETTRWRGLLPRVAGIVLVILASLYAMQHPHSFAYHLIKFVVTP